MKLWISYHSLLFYSYMYIHLLGTFRSLRFTVGWPLKSCTHTGIFPSVSGPSAVKRKPRKVPIMTTEARDTGIAQSRHYHIKGIMGITPLPCPRFSLLLPIFHMPTSPNVSHNALACLLYKYTCTYIIHSTHIYIYKWNILQESRPLVLCSFFLIGYNIFHSIFGA